MTIAIDHVVLTVADIESAINFYRDFLDLEVISFEGGRVALRLGDAKINLHQSDAPREPHAKHPTPGSADLCLRTTIPIDTLIKRAKSLGIEVVLGPVERTGARGELDSIYVHDFDGNLVELSNERSAE
jgi:catechol 2,3-dioxygenase-like lactoylglutathione lyase family enzyme